MTGKFSRGETMQQGHDREPDIRTRLKSQPTLIVGLIAAVLSVASALSAAEPQALEVRSPLPFQVEQRLAFDPQSPPTAPPSGFARVMIRAKSPVTESQAIYEYRATLRDGAAGQSSDWTPFSARLVKGELEAAARIAAGGWYRLEVRCRVDANILAVGAVDPIGVGEVFVVAGQSYASNSNDERLQVTDPMSRVAAYDSTKSIWRVAHDPQPTGDTSDSGSIWPPVGDALAKEWRVPIGFANVAVGATSSAQWAPSGPLHQRLVKAGTALHRFRAVLWQQGESDVIAKTPTQTYVTAVTGIRDAAARAWSFEVPWLLAKSTLHPTVYNDPAGEGRIRQGIDELVKRPGFRPGPDTDTLAGENRGDVKSKRHFSPIGQHRAAAMWVDVIRREVTTTATGK